MTHKHIKKNHKKVQRRRKSIEQVVNNTDEAKTAILEIEEKKYGHGCDIDTSYKTQITIFWNV